MNWALMLKAVAIVGILLVLPIKFLLPKRYLLQQAFRPRVTNSKVFDQKLLAYNGSLPGPYLGQPLRIGVGELGFIVVIQPADGAVPANATAELIQWHAENRDWFSRAVEEYGGVLLRGFQIKTPLEFDSIVADMHPDATGTGLYLGTAPRRKIEGTRFVSSSSEISSPATIPVHLELCYTRNPPSRLYFFVEQPNSGIGGQTPFCDFRQVWRDMPQDMKQSLLTRGLVYHRRYFDEARGGFVDPLQHKSWQAMFQTTDRKEVERMATAEGFHPSWESDGGLLLTHSAEIVRRNDATGEEYWNTHFNVLHADTVLAPLAYSAQLLNDVRALFAYYALNWMLYIRNRVLGHPAGHDVVLGDNNPVPWEVAMGIRNTISKDTWIFDWKAGDVMALDNHRIAHGRMPYYSNDRKVYVAWQ